MTATLFPLLYLTLELPKRIINDAIDPDTVPVAFFGRDFDQITLLAILSGAFFFAVLAHGLLKMKINTMKGVLAERMLRRFRYTLISRILRFPQPYFERTSQGELVSMVTAEAEPMGGLMGDAISQPVLQAGQMITILGFLFVQSFWFGLAACITIPLQAWLIPRIQRQINQLNKKRVIQVRALAGEIGESAAGASTLRTNAGWRYRLSMITDRLGRLYLIRFEIYQKKFFMKFLNNFINQMTPFFFYAVGGYLAIKGDITVGALVAALAAYKDIASPWKELLAYYNQVQDMAVRWDTIAERFAPEGMIDDRLFDGDAGTIGPLKGEVELSRVTVRDADGNAVIEDITATLPEGAFVGVTASSEEDRRALSEILVREVLPVQGGIRIGGQPLNELHQAVVARRIGHVTARPVLFKGTFLDNVLMPLKFQPLAVDTKDPDRAAAILAGNSGDPLAADWTDPRVAGFDSEDDLRAWLLRILDAIGMSDTLFRRGLDLRPADQGADSALARAIVSVRPAVAAALKKAKLGRHVHGLDPQGYNPALPVGDNLLFASPLRPITRMVLAEPGGAVSLLRDIGITEPLIALSRDVIEMLRHIFGVDGTDHPLFGALGLDAATYEAAVELIRSDRWRDVQSLSDEDLALLIIVPFSISAEQIGPAFPVELQERILDLRRSHGARMQEQLADLFQPFSPDTYAPGLSVLENAIFGKIKDSAGARADEVRSLVAACLREAGEQDTVVALIFDTPVPLGGANLPAVITEPMAVCRAVVKKPDVLVLENAMSSLDRDARLAACQGLHALLPGTTTVCIADAFDDAHDFDLHLTLHQGRLVTEDDGAATEQDSAAGADLTRKLRALEQTDLFSGLNRKQLRLLAFGARWYKAHEGEYVFHKGDPPHDGAYMVIEGEAGLYLPKEGEDDVLITTVGPGKLVGELGLIRNVPRALDMKATTDLTCLRIGAEEFLAVVENDAATAFRLLQVVAGYVR